MFYRNPAVIRQISAEYCMIVACLCNFIKIIIVNDLQTYVRGFLVYKAFLDITEKRSDIKIQRDFREN